MIRLGIIGAGLIGWKRAQSLPKDVKLAVVCNRSHEKGKELAAKYKARFEPNWKKVVADPNLDAILVATTHDWLTPIGAGAITNGKHTFIEKPAARNIKEFQKIKKAFKKKHVVVMFGYNHRYHPSIQKAKKIIDSKKYGKVLFIRGRYGHGARLGYEKEWRFQRQVSGGGQLMDQGPHLIDLANYFVGPMNKVIGTVDTLFWKTKLEDSIFFIMKNMKKQVASFSVTCVEWKNLFSLEIMLKNAKIQIDGLGRSYGREKMTLYKMKPQMGPPEVEEFLFPERDASWKKESEVFFQRIKKKDFSSKSIEDAEYVLKTVEKLYNGHI